MSDTRPTLKPIHAVVLDKDNGEIKALERFIKWIEFTKLLAKRFDLEPQQIRDSIRRAHAEIRFHDSVGLLQEITQELRGNFIQISQLQNALSQEWARATEYYPGIVPVLRHWSEQGTLVITHTDCEAIPFICNVYHATRNAIRNGDFRRNRTALGFYDVISCTNGLLPSTDTRDERDDYIDYYSQTYGVPRAFIDKFLNHPNFIIKDGDYKPSAKSTRALLDQFNVDPERAIYIGDSDKDGIEAGQLGVDFVWAAYGTKLSPELVAFCQDVASSAYGYGYDAMLTSLTEKNVSMALRVDDSEKLVSHLTERYRFERHPLKARGFRHS